jgi:phage host-nuclease inhibitor protein Gam
MDMEENKKVASWKDAERALTRIARLNRRLKDKKLKAAEKVAVIEQRLGEESQPLNDELAEIHRSLEHFFRLQHVNSQLDGRSRNLCAGRIGLRSSTKLLIPRPGVTLRKLVQNGLGSCIRIKQDLDRQAMSRLDDATLRCVGAKRVTTDAFYISLKEKE